MRSSGTRKLLRDLCKQLWSHENYAITRKYLRAFDCSEDMLRRRMRIRFDGLYVCKMHYVKFG